MKNCILFFLLSLPIISLGQSFKPDPDVKSSYLNEPAYLLDTVAESKLSKQQLYSNGLNFLSKSFSDSRAVLEMKDPDLGEISFKGTVKVNYTDTLKSEKKKKVVNEVYTDWVDLRFKCKIYVKDERFKIVLSSLEAPMHSLIDVPMTLSLQNERGSNVAALQEARNLIVRITEFMNRPPENEF